MAAHLDQDAARGAAVGEHAAVVLDDVADVEASGPRTCMEVMDVLDALDQAANVEAVGVALRGLLEALEHEGEAVRAGQDGDGG